MYSINTYYINYPSLVRYVEDNKDILSSPDNRAILVQIYTGVTDKRLLRDICRQINYLLPAAKIIGTTTNGEIINGIISSGGIVLSFSVFQHSDVETILFPLTNGDNYELPVAALNNPEARLLILYATPSDYITRLLSCIQSINPNLPVAGGIAGNNLNGSKYLVFTDEEIAEHGFAAALLCGKDLRVTRHNRLGWQPIGKEMTITHADTSRVYTIDNIPAYQVYHHYLGAYQEFDIMDGIEFPLVINKHGIHIARAPMSRYEDDSLGFNGDFANGDTVCFSFGDINLILEQIDDLLLDIRKQPAESIFVYSCLARRSYLQDSAQIETLPLQAIAPTSGFYTGGEFFHADKSNQLLSNTMTAVVLAESETSHPPLSEDYPEADQEQSEEGTAIDNIASRNLSILKALTSLINTVTGELKQTTTELQMVNQQLQYASTHDALTALHNRGYFEQQIRQAGNSSPGLIICDIDGLKLINDILGHDSGDAVLKAAANILKSVAHPNDIVARIGGDEFAILVSGCSQSKLENYSHRIQAAVDRFNHKDPTLPLSISIGCSCSENNELSLRMLFINADDNMYREKLHHSSSVQIDLVQTMMNSLNIRGIIPEAQSQRVQDLLLSFARRNKISTDRMADLSLLARFHNIGKVGIPDRILFKPGLLTLEEKKEVSRHCEIGHRIAHSSPELLPIAGWILKHHEWWNGHGYPLGLDGYDIPFECRMLAIVSAYEAMVHGRPYRQPMSHSQALEKIRLAAGTQFDPDLANTFIEMIEANGPPC